MSAIVGIMIFTNMPRPRPSAAPLVGRSFGHLSLISEVPATKGRRQEVACLCRCWRMVTVLLTHVINGATTSCGCWRAEASSARRKLDLEGKVFGRLAVIRQAGHQGKHLRWRCLCACGNTVITTTNNLRSGGTKSCGCLNREQTRERLTTHGHSGSREHRA